MTKHPPSPVVSFTIAGPWAHFRRVTGNISRLTYRVPPRTTVSGIIAAILGLDRDSYYDTLGTENTAIAIEPQTALTTTTIPQKFRSTAKEDRESEADINNGQSTAVRFNDPREDRKRRVVEYVCNPAYTIHVSIADETIQNDLINHLESGTSTYTPSLGKAKCIATIDYHGTHDATETPSTATLDSIAPRGIDTIPTQDAQLTTERSPADFSLTTGTTGQQRRQLTELTQYTVDTTGGRISITDNSDYPLYNVPTPERDNQDTAHLAFV